MRLSPLAFERPELRAVAAGVLLALSFPKLGHGLVAWVALVPLLRGLDETRGRHGWRLGYLTGVVSGIGLLYWTAIVVVQYGGQGEVVAGGAALLLSMAVALFPAVAAWAAGRWVVAWGRNALLLFPVAWVATELVRDRTFFHFPWCLVGYSQIDLLPFAQLGALAGVYGVSFAVVGCAAVLAWCFGEPSRLRRRLGLTLLGAALLLAYGWGWSRLQGPLPAAKSIRVALVQPSIRQEEKWRPERLTENFELHERLTRERADGARLVVWPESAVPFLYDDSALVRERLDGLVRSGGHYLLFGNDDREGIGQAARIWVGAKLLAPDGALLMRYHKMRLVPFGEYVPLEPILTLGGTFSAKLVDRVGSFTPGDELTLGVVDGIRFGTLICYEAIFPELTWGFRERGADLIVNVTNDAWYGTTSAPYQHFAMARMRAIETGRTLLRAANTGISAIVDPRGRVVAETDLFEQTVLVRDVPVASEATLYAASGDVLAWLCLVAALTLTAASWRARASAADPAASSSAS